MKISELEQVVLGRNKSLFACDLKAAQHELKENIQGASILVIGAAGSIGGAFVKVLACYQPACLWLVDPSENNLVEVVRDLRSSGVKVPGDFGTVAIGFGTAEFAGFLKSQPVFDYILNFTALKHVRSERDPYSLMRLVDVNVIANVHLLNLLENGTTKKVFSVSSDKAVNPQSLMGASKAFMERVFLDLSDVIAFSSARFANVAFSDGSLLHILGIVLKRVNLCPHSQIFDVTSFRIRKRVSFAFFSFAARNRGIFIPRFELNDFLTTFTEISVLE